MKRRAFVLQLGSESQPLQQRFVGCIEEVDTGRELRFRSTDELLTFLGECFELARRRDPEHQPDADVDDYRA